MGEYVDRDVAPIEGETGQFSTTIKTSKGLPPMQLSTKMNEYDEFVRLVKDPPNLTYKQK